VCVFDPKQIQLAKAELTLEDYLGHPHLLTSFIGDLHGFIDEQLEKLGHTRRVIFSSRNFATNPLIVRQMAALTTVPTFVAGAWCDALGLSVARLPFDVPTAQVSLMWTAANDADAGLAWLRSLINEIHHGRRFVSLESA